MRRGVHFADATSVSSQTQTLLSHKLHRVTLNSTTLLSLFIHDQKTFLMTLLAYLSQKEKYGNNFGKNTWCQNKFAIRVIIGLFRNNFIDKRIRCCIKKQYI